MNKRILILLPALFAMGLASCGEESTSTSSSSSSTSSSTSKPVEPLKEYGSLENPKTVKEFLDFCNENVEKENNALTDGVFYVKAVVRQYCYYNNGAFYRIDISDKSDDEDQVPVFSVAKGNGVTVEKLDRDDEVIVKGFGEYYDGRYTIYEGTVKKHYVQPTLLSYKKAECKVTFEDGNFTVDPSFDKSKTYENSTEISFKLKPTDTNKIYSVKANGHLLTPGATDANGYTTYTFKLHGHTNIVVRSGSDIVEKDLPKGNYSLTLEKDVLDLPLQGVDAASTSDINMNFEVKADTDAAIYKKLGVTFSAGSINSYKFNEFGLIFNGSLKMNLTSTGASISSIDIEYYLDVDVNTKVYNSSDASATAVTGTKQDTNKYSNGYKYNYAINSDFANIHYAVNNDYNLMFYYIIINITVA